MNVHFIYNVPPARTLAYLLSKRGNGLYPPLRANERGYFDQSRGHYYINIVFTHDSLTLKAELTYPQKCRKFCHETETLLVL